ncbi:hypothetical protein PCANC_06231 [Puccinia coronata f. sp. avenae]|uniref:Uncharacterized protein n=1 Tax=Puccinia coronata f. sp. avenae TaxID=200324 RepID=A0A2N5TF54_9BASI|nr:hypothetical protein PCANC_17988 [Puccinia coronata f. sp. avenae]PLW24116.1 hypothetical protein PCASD_06706 [Puccinia coronata f. sp. avenae]PLW37855.1 hypothetical protein PCASD_05741 [Puccinia coronata f. sp. avenae]PLW44466.1 hypothetical protein PCANC_06231 [Puccinia coronata f. sp. avenae]
MTAPFLQVLAQADSASGDAADVQAVFGDLEKQGAGKLTGKGNLGASPTGKVSSSGMRTDIVGVANAFLKEPIPPTATGTVFQFLVQFLEKSSQGTGGATGSRASPSAKSGSSKSRSQ